jgi:hypothetical protein
MIAKEIVGRKLSHHIIEIKNHIKSGLERDNFVQNLQNGCGVVVSVGIADDPAEHLNAELTECVVPEPNGILTKID